MTVCKAERAVHPPSLYHAEGHLGTVHSRELRSGLSAIVIRPAEVLCIPEDVLYEALEECPKDQGRVRRSTVKPSPATHAISAVLKAGDTVYLTYRVHKTLFDTI